LERSFFPEVILYLDKIHSRKRFVCDAAPRDSEVYRICWVYLIAANSGAPHQWGNNSPYPLHSLSTNLLPEPLIPPLTIRQFYAIIKQYPKALGGLSL
jgi:hypothetical protein